MRDFVQRLADQLRQAPHSRLGLCDLEIPVKVDLTISAFDFPFDLTFLVQLFSDLGSNARLLDRPLQTTTEHVNVIANRLRKTDGHLVIMTRPWLDHNWSAKELFACLDDGIPTAVVAYAEADEERDADIRYYLKAIPSFDPHRQSFTGFCNFVAFWLARARDYRETKGSLLR